MTSPVRLITVRPWAKVKEVLRSTAVSLGRYALKQPAVRNAAGRLLDLSPHLKRRMIALVSGVSLSEVMPTATSIHLASMKVGDGLARSTADAYQQLKRAVREAIDTSAPSRASAKTMRVDGTSRRRLAFVSSLAPGENQHEVSELLSLLAESYDVDLIGDQVDSAVVLRADQWGYRDAAWLRAHASTYDRVVYHFGDWRFLAPTLALLKDIPGTVVLENFHFGPLLRRVESSGQCPGIVQHSLYESHGYAALIEHEKSDAATESYPCNWQVLADADGVIVRYHHWRDLVEHWYGPGLARGVRVLPLTQRALSDGSPRELARTRLGLPKGAFVFACVGNGEPGAPIHRLLAAWRLSGLAKSGRAVLVLADDMGGAPRVHLPQAVSSHAPMGDAVVRCATITATQYTDLLDAADVIVWPGDGFCGAIRDGLIRGIPTIAGSCGTPEGLPVQAMWLLGEACDERSIADALAALYQEPERYRQLAEAARSYMDGVTASAAAPAAYQDAIESFAQSSPRQRLAERAREVAIAMSGTPAEDAQWISAARALAGAHPLEGAQGKLLVDVSTLVGTDAKSGVQRVVRNVLTQLLSGPFKHQRVEPVYADPRGGYRYARHFASEFLGLSHAPDVDAEVEMSAGDTFLGLDLCAHIIPDRVNDFRLLRERGVSIQFVVYDLLPALHPDWFPAELTAHLQRWYHAIAEVSDRVIAISKSVAAEYRDWLDTAVPARTTPLKIGYFHLGADIEAEAPAAELDPATRSAIEAIAGRPVVLMVGTVEPRKGHQVALDAFEELWSKGSEAVLVVVGKRGWRVDPLASRLLTHAELGHRLHWFQGATDQALEHIYRHSALLLAASFGEGFGLPLIEAAHRGLPLLVRDIPVFREVAGKGATYFRDDSPAGLASSVALALEAWRRGELPAPGQVRALSWSQSTVDLCEALNGRRDLHSWQPAHRPESLQAYPVLKVKEKPLAHDGQS
jgi:glycosyltransferase involved in cell wall biosynthesis